jgi:hypothetical protein
MEALDPYVSLTLEDSTVISSSSSSQGESTSSNIITTTPFQSADQSWQYIRIGAHYFCSLVSSSSATADITSQTTRRITHLPNRFDQSPTAQFPTIRIGDSVQTFAASDDTDDAGLSACIASSFAADVICPVPSCRQELSSQEEKDKHLLAHRTAAPTAPTGRKALSSKASNNRALTVSAEIRVIEKLHMLTAVVN